MKTEDLEMDPYPSATLDTKALEAVLSPQGSDIIHVCLGHWEQAHQPWTPLWTQVIWPGCCPAQLQSWKQTR